MISELLDAIRLASMGYGELRCVSIISHVLDDRTTDQVRSDDDPQAILLAFEPLGAAYAFEDVAVTERIDLDEVCTAPASIVDADDVMCHYNFVQVASVPVALQIR